MDGVNVVITSLGKAPLHTIRGEKCGKTTDKKIN